MVKPYYHTKPQHSGYPGLLRKSRSFNIVYGTLGPTSVSLWGPNMLEDVWIMHPYHHITVYCVQCVGLAHIFADRVIRLPRASPLVTFHPFYQADVLLYAIGNRPGCTMTMVRARSMTGPLCRWIAITCTIGISCTYFFWSFFSPSLWSFFHILFSCNLVGVIYDTLCVLWWHLHLSYLLCKDHSCHCKLLLVLC